MCTLRIWVVPACPVDAARDTQVGREVESCAGNLSVMTSKCVDTCAGKKCDDGNGGE